MMNWTNQTNQICFNEQILKKLILVSLKNGCKKRFCHNFWQRKGILIFSISKLI